ncbi:MAG: ROK family protein [Atopobiaceae bacterium]|jgi:glucokinase|nr:ROK family protein [Atopobiaceae bacterium]MCI2174181.1 ROK family protein [Atopobiaceae bacterium]MCI2206822.1 ROK family protein [Atopobiaceae bacterium]
MATITDPDVLAAASEPEGLLDDVDQTRGLLVGIDVGGTSIKVGVFTMDGDELDHESIPTEHIDSDEAFDAIAGSIVVLVAKAAESTHASAIANAPEVASVPFAVRGVGLAVPGVVDAAGHLLMTPNITLDLDGLMAALRRAFPSAVVVPLNDANAAALGELWKGAGGGVENLVLVTLGTGVGAGVVIDCNVLAGAHGGAGEVGHVCVNPDETATCGCGRHGCLEQYASAQGIVRLYQAECARTGQQPVPIAHATDSLAVFDAVKAGDPCARAAVDAAADYLAHALASVACVVDPEVFVIGGGVSGGFDLFGDTLRERYRRYAISAEADTPIVVATLGNRAGRVGAAFQARAAAEH